MEEINYALIVLYAMVAIASPGPATLAIAGTSMKHGRLLGMFLASGVLTGSLIWSVSAAFGLAVIMHKYGWLFEVLKYCGAMYLLYLSYKSIRSVFRPTELHFVTITDMSAGRSFLKGLLIHLTNPKAVLFFGSLYSIGVPVGTDTLGMISVIVSLGLVSSVVFLGYAFFFSYSGVRGVYLKAKKLFDSVFAILFGAASFKILFGGFGR
jgi:threonine efflux protein